MCNETLMILLIVGLLTFVIFLMYMNKSQVADVRQVATTTTVEGFEETTLQSLLAQYQALTDDEKTQLAQAIGLPLSSDDDMIHKSAIPPQRECPASEFNELDYVKRSSIPPCPEPKPCVAPKVVVDADLCKQQECPPCPSVPECSRVETKQVPVFVTKTIRLDADGNEVSTTVEQSDVELGEGLLASGSATPETTVAETTVTTNNTPQAEPEATEAAGLITRLSDSLFG
jgi:hypothetical protein